MKESLIIITDQKFNKGDMKKKYRLNKEINYLR